jgi:DNA-binding NarL/FixJ family response regulator
LELNPLLGEITRYFQELFRTQQESLQTKNHTSLTAREHEVMMGLTQGRSEKQVAADLNISTQTVHNHVKKIYAKLDVHSRTEAVMKYLHA